MSLIDDALKRAQSAQGVTPAEPGRAGHTPLPLPDPRRAQRRRLRRYALLALVPVAAAAALLVVVRPRPEPESRPREPAGFALPASPPTAAPVSPEITPLRRADISGEAFVPPPAELREPVAQSLPAEEPAAPPMDPAPAARDLSDPAPRESTVSVTRIEPPGPPMVASGSPMIVRAEEAPPLSRPQEARPSPPTRGRSFVREAPAPSGARLTLDGIVFSDENPAAVINGRVVSVGSFVEGCEVVRIRSDRVELDDDGTTIVLLLK